MPYQAPETSDSESAWTVNATFGNVEAVGVHCTITVEGSAVGTDGDQALQALVDALHGNAQFKNVYAASTYSEQQTRQMTPSS